MNNTMQLYIDEDKQVKGYPLTSPDRVIDEKGVSIDKRLKNNVKYDVIGQGIGVPGIDGKYDDTELVGKIDKINEQMNDKVDLKNNIKVINVNGYGIKTDGSIYNSDDLEKIISENINTYFNAGIYIFNNLSITNKNNITICGDNSNINISYTSEISNCDKITFKNINFIHKNSIHNTILFSNCSNITFINCIIDGKNICKNGISFENCSNIQIYNTSVKNFTFRTGLDFKNCQEIKINNCYFENIGGPAVAFKWGNSGCYVHNSIFKNCCIFDWSNGQGSDGVIDFYGAFETYGKNKYGIISGNRIEGFGITTNQTTGIRVISSDFITVENNIISGGIGSCFYLTVADRVRQSDGVLFDSIGCTLSNNILILDKSVNMFISISGKVSSCNVIGNKMLNYGGSAISEWGPSIRIIQTTETSNHVIIEKNCLGSESSKLPLAGINIGKSNKNTIIRDNYIFTLRTPLLITTGTGVIIEGNWLGSELNDSSVCNISNGIIRNNIRCYNRNFSIGEQNTNVLVGDTLDNF